MDLKLLGEGLPVSVVDLTVVSVVVASVVASEVLDTEWIAATVVVLDGEVLAPVVTVVVSVALLVATVASKEVLLADRKVLEMDPTAVATLEVAAKEVKVVRLVMVANHPSPPTRLPTSNLSWKVAKPAMVSVAPPAMVAMVAWATISSKVHTEVKVKVDCLFPKNRKSYDLTYVGANDVVDSPRIWYKNLLQLRVRHSGK
jgi:hypothetical protein